MDQRYQLLPMEVEMHKKRLADGYNNRTTPCLAERSGYYLDTDLGENQQFKGTLQRLTTALEAMKYKFPGTKGKEYAMRVVVMPQVGYTGQETILTEAQIQKLDSVALAYSRKNLKLLAGFPTASLSHHQLINHSLPSSIYYEARLGSQWKISAEQIAHLSMSMNIWFAHCGHVA
jgi:hypothetical protein